MSTTAISLALLPVKNEIKPIVQMNQDGMISSRGGAQTQDGVIYRGYLSNNKETTAYGRLGRPRRNHQSTGDIVDFYI